MFWGFSAGKGIDCMAVISNYILALQHFCTVRSDKNYFHYLR